MTAVLAGAMALASARARGLATQDPPPTAPATTQPDVSAYVGELSSALRQGAPQQRREAARRLVEVGTPEALTQIRSGLSSPDSATALACAQAASEAAAVDPSWEAPLEKALGKDRALTEAAAVALARLDNPAAVDALVRFAQSAGQPFRGSAIGAMGHLVRKPVAVALVAIVTDPLEPREVRLAASQALGQMSGVASPPEDPAQWRQWWSPISPLPDDRWRAVVLEEQHARLQADRDRDVRKAAQEGESIQKLVRNQYEHAVADRSRVLIGFLNDLDPAVRAAAAGIVPDAVSFGHPIPQDVHSRLIDLIGDADPEVRIKSAQALAKLADSNALDPLLRQLRVERDVQVKVALVGAIGFGNDPRAVAELRKLLMDASPAVAAAAADALRSLAPAIQQANPQEADQLYSELKRVLVERSGPPGQPKPGMATTDLRVALLGALTPLANSHSQEMLDFVPAFFKQVEGPPVRAAAMDALAPLGSAGGSLIVQALDAENDPSVRAEGAKALGMTHAWGFSNKLFGMSHDDLNPRVRAAAWVGFSSLLPYGDAAQLLRWAEDLGQQHEWDHEVIVLRQACEKLDPQDKDQATTLAMERETIADRYLRDFDPSQPELAIPYYRESLDYWQDPRQRSGQNRALGLVAKLMEAYLNARQYQQALQFASQEIHDDDRTKARIGAVIRNTADRLRESKSPSDWESARQLIDGALEMQPTLDISIQDALRLIRKRLPSPPATEPAR
jgi:HEAT repeat protein